VPSQKKDRIQRTLSLSFCKDGGVDFQGGGPISEELKFI
jgi:hypothetical protein